MGAKVKLEVVLRPFELENGRKLWHDFNKKHSDKRKKYVSKTAHFHKYVKFLSLEEKDDLKAWLEYKLQALDDYYLGYSTTEKEESIYELKAQFYKACLGEL